MLVPAVSPDYLNSVSVPFELKAAHFIESYPIRSVPQILRKAAIGPIEVVGSKYLVKCRFGLLRNLMADNTSFRLDFDESLINLNVMALALISRFAAAAASSQHFEIVPKWAVKCPEWLSLIDNF